MSSEKRFGLPSLIVVCIATMFIVSAPFYILASDIGDLSEITASAWGTVGLVVTAGVSVLVKVMAWAMKKKEEE